MGRIFSVEILRGWIWSLRLRSFEVGGICSLRIRRGVQASECRRRPRVSWRSRSTLMVGEIDKSCDGLTEIC